MVLLEMMISHSLPLGSVIFLTEVVQLHVEDINFSVVVDGCWGKHDENS